MLSLCSTLGPVALPASFLCPGHLRFGLAAEVPGEMAALIIIFKISTESVYNWNFLITLMSF